MFNLITHHETVLIVNDSGELAQSFANREGSGYIFVRIASLPAVGVEETLTEAPLAGYTITSVAGGGVTLRNGSFFLCADPHGVAVSVDRLVAGAWETFRPVPATDVITVVQASPVQEEQARFSRRVAELNASSQPVRLHFGAGTVPRHGFLNIDIDLQCRPFYRDNRDQMFIFPFADQPWTISAETVDYIYHEDFIEHVDQLTQIKFLAEAFRVLKFGAWHRLNTPSLIPAMRYNSDFSLGVLGVYTGEAQWGHVMLLTPSYLTEIARMIGYREVVFTTKNSGVSPFAVNDTRPFSDRSEIYGNIYADLLK